MHTKRFFKSAVLSVVLISLMGGAVSCTNREVVAASAGALVGVIVGSAITQDRYERMPRRPRQVPYYRHCHQYVTQGWVVHRTPYGHYIQQGYQQYQVHCMSLGNDIPARITNEMVAEVLKTDVESADQILAALMLAQDGDASGISDLGLAAEDLNALARFEIPSEDGIRRIGASLKHDSIDTTIMVLERLKAEAEAQAAARNQGSEA